MKATIVTVHRGQPEEWSAERHDCPMCSGVGTVARIPPLHLARLVAHFGDDGTTHVCHPGLGGCNHGFTDAAVAPQETSL